MGHHLALNKDKIEKMRNEGRGQGENAAYIPWLMIDDFASLGRGNRIKDIHNGRVHHLFSDLEAEYYSILAWNPDIIDVREQYPLDPEKTEKIARRLGYAHAKNQDGSSYIMTTDFLVTFQDPDTGKIELFARSVKPSESLNNKRILQKQQIEEQYWKELRIKWKCVTENSFSRQKAKNIRKVLAHYNFSIIENDQDIIEKELIEQIVKATDNTLQSVCDAVGNKYKLASGEMLSLFYHLVAHRIVNVDMEHKFLPTMNIGHIINVEDLMEFISNQKEAYENESCG